jgi:UDP-N-acetylglucosamine:LPS N-acetylglucosamine transferase
MPKGWGLLEFLANQFNHSFIRKFDECWVMDSDKTPHLAGELSHPPLMESIVRYIGPVSRFAGKKIESSNKIEILVILGGPEPQRTILKEILRGQISGSRFKAVIAGGTFKSDETDIHPDIRYLPYADSRQLAELIQSADIIICRSGYSSIMDLIALEHTAILIPTPGQPEQEYLAEYLGNKRYFLSYTQSEFDLNKAVEDWKKFKHQIPKIKFNMFPH